MGLELASHLIPPHSAEETFKYFFSLEDMLDDKFLVYSHQTYPFSIVLPQSAWEEAEEADLQQSWGSFIITRGLPYGCEA